MNFQKIALDVIRDYIKDKSIVVTDETSLIGDGSILDSMSLVELCLELEDVAEECGFDFDWTSEAAMSKSKSIFRTVGALSFEFDRQGKLS